MSEDIIIRNDKNIAALKRRRRISIAVGAVVAIGLIVGLIILLVHVATKRYDVVRVSNFSELSRRVPDKAQEEFGGYLYHLLRQHFEVPANGADIIATIRPETFNVTSSGGVDTAEFIVDIEDYKQSYDAVLSWSDKVELAESARIECTTKDKSKYPDVDCYGMNTTSNSIESYLPHELYLEAGEKVELEYGFTTSDGQDIVIITVSSCGNRGLEEEALSKTRSWVQKQGIKDENVFYKLEPIYNNCILGGDA